MSCTSRFRDFSSEATCKTGRGKGGKAELYNNTYMHTCACVPLCTQNMYMYAYGYTRHFIIVIYWQAGWLVDGHEKELGHERGAFCRLFSV